MRQNTLKTLAVKILANLFILTVVITVFYFIGQAHKSPQAQAAELPRCGLASNTCAVGTNDSTYHYNSLTKCYEWGCVFGLITIPCSQCENSCGNGNIDIGEDCDGSNLGGETCLTQGYDSGKLACGSDCFFNIDGCTRTTCGDGKIDKPAEQCEGTNLDGQTCETQGYAGGTLKCSSADCIFDTSLCTQAVCGNGKKEGNEQCDGYDFGGQDCASFKCTGGVPLCFGCVINKDTCTGCPQTTTTSCASTVFSDWSTPGDCSKGCCGSLDKKVASGLTASSSGLCVGGRTATGFTEANAFGQPISLGSEVMAWTWSCGQATCRAEKKAQCASEVASVSYACNPSTIFTSYDDYLTALCKRKGTDSTWGAAWVATCAKVGVASGLKGTDSDVSPLCEGGIENNDTDLCTSIDTNYNKVWYCKGSVPPGGAPDSNKVHCEVGWAPNSTCGTANKAKYYANTSLCASDPVWNNFFDLINKGDNPELCGPGSKVYSPNSSKYSMAGGDTSDFSGFDNNATKYFDWRCRYDVAGNDRKGKPVDCQATLYSSCSGGDAVCGQATGKKFSGAGAGPQTGFCKTGKLGGSILEKVTYDKTNHKWNWTCLPQDSKKNSVNCSVTATVWCGSAGTSNQEYSTREAVRTAGTCTGSAGELFPKGATLTQQIKDNTMNWEWVCVDSTDTTVFADCKASNGKCGQAGGLVLSEATFDGGKGGLGFLCSDGSTPTATLGFNRQYQVDEWTWNCGTTDCSATKLSCGWADGNKYFKANFDNQGNNSATFLCSKPRGVDNFNYTDDLDQAHVTSQATWTWNCLGDRGDSVSGCSANRYGCGWANNHNVVKFYDLNAPYNSNTGWNTPGASSEFCTYDATRSDLNSGETSAMWVCKDPNNASQYEWCATDYTTCGSVTNYHNSYYPQAKKYYYQSTLESSSFQLSNSLCINHSNVGDITDNGPTLSWSCSDDFGFSSYTCEVNKINCGAGEGNNNFNSWSSCVNPFDGSNQCLCLGGNNKAVDGFDSGLLTPILRKTDDPLIKKADWYCLDDFGRGGVTGEMGRNCWATCFGSTCN